jgi:hypothetical protein
VRNGLRNSVLVGLVLLAVAACGWLIWNRDAGGEEAWEGSEVVAAEPAGEAGAAAIEAAASQRSDAVAEAATRTEVAAAKGLKTWPVRVVGPEGEAVAGAEVWFAKAQYRFGPGFDASRMRDQQLFYWAPELVHRRRGSSVRTDSEGLALVPLIEGDRLVAMHDSRYGVVQVHRHNEPPDGGWEIRLEADAGFRVQVVDDKGRGVEDVLVSLRMRWHDAYGGNEQQHTVPLGYTEAGTGSVEARHLQRLVREVVPDRQGKKTGTLIASVPGAPEGPVVDLGALPGEPIQITLPAGGSVRVRALDRAGKPVGKDVAVRMRQIGPERNNLEWTRTPDANGEVTFQPVPVGRRWQARMNNIEGSASIDFAGPASPDATVEVTLQQKAQGNAALVGRLVDDKGAPLGEGTASTWIVNGKEREENWIRIDAEGRFRLPVPSKMAGGAVDRIAIDPRFEAAQWSSTGLRADLLHFVLPPAGQEKDVGDLKALPAPLLAEGRVTGDEPEVLQGVSVHFEQQSVREGKVHWSYLQDALVVRGEEGRFELRGETQAVRLRVRAQGERFLASEPVEFDAGARGLELEVQRGGVLEAQLLTDFRWGWEGLRPTLTPLPPVKSPVRPGQCVDRQAERARFLWLGLSPGKYRFELQVPSLPRPLVAFDEIEIRSGERTRDARLLPLDLRGRLRRIELTIVDEHRKPVSVWGTEVLVVDVDPERAPARVDAQQAPVPLLLETPVDIVVRAPGRRRQELRGVYESREIVLTAGLAVEIALEGEMPKLPDGVTLSASLACKEKVPERNAPSARVENGSARLKVSTPGRYGLTLTLSRRRALNRTENFGPLHAPELNEWFQRSSSVPIEGFEPREVVVAEQLGEQKFTIKVPPDSFAQALKKLKP